LSTLPLLWPFHKLCQMVQENTGKLSFAAIYRSSVLLPSCGSLGVSA
jgi:hypothetical protein